MAEAIAAPTRGLTGITANDLIEELQERGYYTDFNTANKLHMALTTHKGVCGARLVGPQGSGKTVLTKLIADIMGRKYFYLQATRGMTEAELFFGIMPDDTTQSGFARFDGTILQAVKATHEGPVVLCLDEWDKTRPTSDGFLLDFLQEGRISHPAVKTAAVTDNLMVFICTNLDRELSEPLQRRLPVIDLGHPSIEVMFMLLSKTMPQSPYIQHAVKIYAQTISAGLAKPATAQELIQLLGALGQYENATVADLDTMLDVFILKTESDRVRFRAWCKNNSSTTLTKLAEDARAKSAATKKEPVTGVNNEPNFVPVVITTPENDHFPKLEKRVMREWHTEPPRRQTSALGASAEFFHPNVNTAMSMLPGFLKNPEAWAVVDGHIATFERLVGINGIRRIAGLMLPLDTSAIAFLEIPHPIPGREFNLMKIASTVREVELGRCAVVQAQIASQQIKKAPASPNKLTHFSATEVHGHVFIEEHKTKVWFRATPSLFEIGFSTINDRIMVVPILKMFLTEPFMMWMLGEQKANDSTVYSAHSYGTGRPVYHGLYAHNTTTTSSEVIDEIRKNNRLLNQRIAEGYAQTA